MSDLKVGEAFKDKVYITTTATGAAKAGLATVTCVVIDESGNRAAGVVAEESDGWYTCSFTPDASGTWSTEWDSGDASLYTVYFAPKIFKVGGGTIADIYGKVDTEVGSLQTAVNTVATYHDKPAQNSADNAYIRDVVGNKTDTIAGTSLVSLVKVVDGNVDDVKVYTTKPDADTNDNDNIGDICGNKEDTANTTVGNTSSLMRYSKGTLNQLASVRARTDHHLVTRTWFSDSQAEVVADTSHTDAALPSVVLPNIAGTIVHAYAGFKFRMVENTYAGANKLSGAQEIQVKENAAGAFTDAINFVDDQFGLAASTREGGDCIIGDIDLVAEVAAFNKTYAFQWDEPLTDQNALHFNDVQTFLIISYY